MNKKKKIVLGDDTAPYEYLSPLVECLVEAGNRPMREDAKYGYFYPTQGGWICSLAHRIDWSLLQQRFDLPDTISYDPLSDELFDAHSWCVILGSCTEPTRDNARSILQ